MALEADPVTEIAPPTGRVSAPVHWWAPEDSTAPQVDLAGTWDFRLYDSVREADADPDREWETIELPNHWVLTGGKDWSRGKPIYTNIQFPFPLSPPNPPDENPTADHRRTLTLDGELWEQVDAAHKILLRVGGIESLGLISINGERVGEFRGSRLQQDYDITGMLHEGDNDIEVRVHQWSAMSYIEDQDEWWLPGIFRTLELLVRPVGSIDDVWVQPAYDHLTGAGSLTVSVDARPEAFPVDVAVAELGISCTLTAEAPSVCLEAAAVEPWSAEEPRLYELVVTASGETRRQKVGFRTVVITDGPNPVITVNGRKIVFLGVNRHEITPDGGRAFDEEVARADMLKMKRHNINAFRTSHYPPHPRVIEMADEFGFWVLEECDMESHGFFCPPSERNPSNDPRWRETMVNRVQRTVHRDFNHPSVVVWSLGNESGAGGNMAAMADAVRELDPYRPIHYEGDQHGLFTDVYSRMYPTLNEVEHILADEGVFGDEKTPRAHLRTKPFIMCEYAHSMGNGPGALAEYVEQFFRKNNRHNGGFIWEWREHGLRTWAPDGTEYFGYGGDFGEQVHDGPFVMDGLVQPDGALTPAMTEVWAAYAPIRLTIDAERHALTVSSRYHTVDASYLNLVLVVDGDETDCGPLSVAPGEETTFDIEKLVASSVPTDARITARVELNTDLVWASTGHVVAQVQYVPPVSLQEYRQADAAFASLVVGVADADPAPIGFSLDGSATALFGQPISGPRTTVWRAPTDNDSIASPDGFRDADPFEHLNGLMEPSSKDFWLSQRVHLLNTRVDELERGDGFQTRKLFIAAPDSKRFLWVTEKWRWNSEAADLSWEVAPSDGWTGTWPRLGLSLALPQSYDSARWVGYGPLEAYADSTAGAFLGEYAGSLDELMFMYSHPQANGHRPGLRALDVVGDGVPTLHVETFPDRSLPARWGRRPGFTLSAWDDHEIESAQHPYQLPPRSGTHLTFDAYQHGLGSRSCGPDVLPRYALTPRGARIRLRFSRG